jgi:hypothetical protein
MGKKFLTTITLPNLSSPPSSPSVGDMYFDTTLGKIGVYTSSGWVYYLYQIEDGSVTTTKIADGAVTSSKLAPGTAVANLGYTPVNKAGDTMSGSLTVPSLLGPDNANLLISGRSYGVEIRIDEDSSGSDTFRITRGSGGSTTLMLVQNTGNVGIGTNSPTQKLDVAGNVSGVQFISTATTGTAPFQVNSTTKVNNLNADLLDGYDASTSSTANTIAVRDSSGNISANRFISTVASGTAPLQVSSNTLVTNLNADLLDGYHASFESSVNTIALRDSSGRLKAQQFFIDRKTLTITDAPKWVRFAQSPSNASNNFGLFEIRWTMSGVHGHILVAIGANFSDSNSNPNINVLSRSEYAWGLGVSKIRLLRKSTYDQMYLEVYIENGDTTRPLTLEIIQLQGYGWSMIDLVDGGVPTGYTENVITATSPFVVGKDDNNSLRLNYNGRVGIGTLSPTEKLEVNGNIKASSFISTATTGTPPLQVSSNTLVTNLNADLLDGYNSSTNSTPSTVAVRDASGNLSASSFISTASTGTAPFQISSTTKVANLNADLLDGYDSTDFARKAENATITGNWTFNGNLTIQQGRLISYNTNHKVLYPRWGFATNQGNSHGKWQKIGTFTFSVNYTKCHIHAIAWGGRDIDDPCSTQHLVMELDTGNSNSIDTTNYILGLYLEHVPTSGTARYAIRDARIVIPDPTNAPNVAELWVQWNISWATISPEVHIIGPSNVTIDIATNLADDANTAPTSPPSTGTVLSPNHTSVAELANKLATARTISLGGSLSGSTTFDGSSNVTINASINSGAVGTTQIADGAVTASKLASGAVTGNLGYTPVNKAGDTMTGTLVLTSTTPMQVTSSTLITNLNADLVDGYHASDFPRKSENATINGTWTFSATPSFGSGLRFTGGTSTWTSNEWAKVADLFKGQALVWRTGGGLSVGLGVGGSSNTIYFSSSTVDDNSAPASYPIVFDMENGRIGIGTTGPTEKIDIRTGNIRVDSSAVIKFGDRRTINVYVDHSSDTNTRYYYLGKISSHNGILKVQGIMGGHTPSEGRANVDLQFSYRDGFRADGEVIGNIGRADIYVYAPSGDSYIYVYLVTNTWALVNLELSSVGTANIEFNGTYATSPPNLGTPIFQLSTDTSKNILWVDSNRNVKASRFISTVGTGTAPLQVSSTTKVDNLNADLLDGYDSTDFPRKNENATITGSWTFNNNISVNSATVNQNLVVAGNTIANSSGIPYAPLPALGNRGRDILVDRVAVWGDGMYPFALDLFKSDGWFTIPRHILYGSYGQRLMGSDLARSNTTRVVRLYIVCISNMRSIYDPTNQYWNNGRTTGKPWVRLIKMNGGTWESAISSVDAWSESPNIRVYILEIPISVLDSYFQVALGIWWDASSPSWPTSNISGDTVPNNYQNYGVDIQWTIYQVWFEIYDRY